MTGEEPQKWPAIPSAVPLSPPLKFYLRLSMQLCDRNPARRLHSLDELEHEMCEIERKLQFGETFRDRIIHFRKAAIREVFGATYQLLRWFRRHWCLGPALVCAFGTAVWMAWPEKPYDITAEVTQEYVNKKAGISMTIPKQWDVVSASTMLEFYNDPGEDLKQYLSPKYLKAMKMGLENGVEFIFCDADEKFRDNITVSPQTKAPANFANAPLDGVQLMIRGIFQQNGVETKIHKLQRTTILGAPAIMVDATNYVSPKMAEGCRVNMYMIMRTPETMIDITLTTKHETFEKRKEEFEAVLKTLKFQPPYSGKK